MTTTLTRYEPFANTLRLPDAMEQLLNESWVSPRSLFGWSTKGMPLDFYETDDAYVVTAFMPGVPADKLDVNVQQNILSICGEPGDAHPEGVRYLIKERGNGVFQRSIQLPAPVDTNKVVAALNDGILTITLPKQEGFKPRRIRVQAA
jgi:HSP20 family protein